MAIDLIDYEEKYRIAGEYRATQDGYNKQIEIAQRRLQDTDLARAQAERDASAPLVRPSSLSLPPAMPDTREPREGIHQAAQDEYQKARDDLDALTARENAVATCLRASETEG